MKYNKIHTKISSFAVLFLAVIFLCGCSTRKNTPINRGYHNMTSRFNVNFNGKEALKNGEEEHAKLCKDNYITTLPIYVYPPKEELSSIYPSMDRVIEKGSKCIYKHSMFFKGKEYVKNIDDAYLMMGKAYFYKQDYQQAQRIFNYILTTHKNGNCVEEAMIWNARAALRMGYYGQAEDLINEARYYVEPKKSKKLSLQYAAAGAEYHLTAPDGDRQTAINYIDDVLKNKPKKLFKTRMYFILGQLYELDEQPAMAHDYFLWVSKHSPDYDLEFNARMHLATNYDGSPAKRSQIIKELNKMLAEEKNKDYYDQIYYALSEIDRIDEDTTAQMDKLAKSVAAYANNDFQRTHSALRLADLYFEQEKYPQAKAYYDTATVSMPKTYPNYAEIKRKSQVLTELVDNLQLVVVQDSLQRIAKMSKKDRDRWVKGKINEYKQEKARREKEERDKELALQSALGYANYNNQLNNQGSSGKWYFYNSTLMAAGKTEFLRKWGSRKLEDNWRISNKQQLSFEDMANLNNPKANGDDTEYDEDGNPILKRETDPEKERYYTQDLPLTEGAMDTSNQMIAEALYQAAVIYLDLLNDRPRGCETLEKYYQRFPDTEMSPAVLYLLYLNYSQMKNGKAEQPKEIILTKYADTDYARLIREPDYYKKVAAALKQMENTYETVYQDYMNKQWAKVIQTSELAIPSCTDRVLRSKFAYLRAVSVGQVQGKDQYRNALQGVVTEYGDLPVSDLARLLLSDLEPEAQSVSQTQGDPEKQETQGESPFIFNADEWHYVALIVNVHKVKVMDLKVQISDFNKEFYSLQNLSLNSFYINQDEQIVTVSRFRNASAAMDYYNGLIRNAIFQPYLKEKSIVPYAMGAVNYGIYYKQRDARPMYEEFFQKNYLKP